MPADRRRATFRPPPAQVGLSWSEREALRPGSLGAASEVWAPIPVNGRHVPCVVFLQPLLLQGKVLFGVLRG